MKRALTYISTIATATVAVAVAYQRGHDRGYREAEFDSDPTSFDELIEQKREMVKNDRREMMQGLEMQLRAREAMDDATDGIDDSVREQARRTGADPARLQEAIDSFVTEQYDGK